MRKLVVASAASLLCLGVATSVAEDETETETHVVRTEVHFEFDSADLSDSARARLDEAADWLRTNETGIILIEGHADRVGSVVYNKRLAERRAQAARQFLIEQGVRADRIRILSYGEGLPAVDTPDSERANRRIVILGVQREPIVETRTERVEVPVYERFEVPVSDTTPATPRSRPARGNLELQVMAGGGVTDFIADYADSIVDMGGLWTARVAVGTNRWVGFEAAYVGTAQDVDAIGVNDNAVIVGQGLEANLRLNFIRNGRYRPFIFAGFGWTNYEVTNMDASVAAMNESDSVVHVPAGVGLGVRLTGPWVLDVRGTVRGALDDTMFERRAPDSGLENWSTTAQLGLAF